MSEVKGEKLSLEHGDIEFGIQVEQWDDGSTVVTIIDQDLNAGTHSQVMRHLPDIVNQVLAQHFPNKVLSDLGWRLCRFDRIRDIHIGGIKEGGRPSSFGFGQSLVDNSNRLGIYRVFTNPRLDGAGYYTEDDLGKLSDTQLNLWLDSMPIQERLNFIGSELFKTSLSRDLIARIDFKQSTLRALMQDILGPASSLNPDDYPALRDHFYSPIDIQTGRHMGDTVYSSNGRLVAAIPEIVELSSRLTGTAHIDNPSPGFAIAFAFANDPPQGNYEPVVSFPSAAHFEFFVSEANRFADTREYIDIVPAVNNGLRGTQNAVLERIANHLNDNGITVSAEDAHRLQLLAADSGSTSMLSMHSALMAQNMRLFDEQEVMGLLDTFVNNADQEWVSEYRGGMSNWDSLSPEQKLEFGRLHLSVLGGLYELDPPALFAEDLEPTSKGVYVTKANALDGEIRLNNSDGLNMFDKPFGEFINTISHEFGHHYSRHLAFGASEYARTRLNDEDRARVRILELDDPNYQRGLLFAANNNHMHPYGIYLDSGSFGAKAYRNQPEEMHAFQFGDRFERQVANAIDAVQMVENPNVIFDRAVAYAEAVNEARQRAVSSERALRPEFLEATSRFIDAVQVVTEEMQRDAPDMRATILLSQEGNGLIQEIKNIHLEQLETVRELEDPEKPSALLQRVQLSNYVELEALGNLQDRAIDLIYLTNSITHPDPDLRRNFQPRPQSDKPDQDLTDIRVGENKNEQRARAALEKDSRYADPIGMGDGDDPRFRLPSDAEISKMLGGVPVLSLRPEDLPYFKRSAFDAYNSVQLTDRLSAAYDRIINFCPAWDGQHSDLGMIATSRAAAVMTWSVREQPQMFVMLRPSNEVDAVQYLANSADIKPERITNPIPKNIIDFINTQHEIGHMVANIEGLNQSPFESELYADTYALEEYIRRGGEPEIVRAYIDERALTGFFRQPSKYWLSGNLEHHFFGSTDLPFEGTDALPALAELRIRVVAELADPTTYGMHPDFVPDWSSEHIRMALSENHPPFDRVDVYTRLHYQALLNMIGSKHEPHNRSITDFSEVDQLRALDRILADTPDLDPQTRAVGIQVLDAAQRFTPSLMPEQRLTQPRIRNSNLTDDVRARVVADTDTRAPNEFVPEQRTADAPTQTEVVQNADLIEDKANQLDYADNQKRGIVIDDVRPPREPPTIPRQTPIFEILKQRNEDTLTRIESLSKSEIMAMPAAERLELWKGMSWIFADMTYSASGSKHTRDDKALQKLIHSTEMSPEFIDWFSEKLGAMTEKHAPNFQNIPREDAPRAVLNSLQNLSREAGYQGNIDLEITPNNGVYAACYLGISKDGDAAGFKFTRDSLAPRNIGPVVLHEFSHLLLDLGAEHTFFDDLPDHLRPDLEIIQISQAHLYVSSEESREFYRKQPSERFPQAAERAGRGLIGFEARFHERVLDKIGSLVPEPIKKAVHNARNAIDADPEFQRIRSDFVEIKESFRDLNTKFNGVSIVGANGVGVGMGAMAIINADGDAGMIAIGSADIAMSTADTVLDMAQASGKTISQGVLKGAMRANIVLTVADGAYQVYKEDGNFIDEDGSIGHKGERLTAVTMTAGAGLGTGALLGGTGFLGAAAGGTIVTGAAAVAAPVIVVGAAVIGTGLVAERAIEVRRIHEDTRELIDDMTEAEKFRESDRPSIADYKQCMLSSMRFSDMMRDTVLVGEIERNSQHDGYRITNLDEIDWTNPKNIAEFERMIDLALEEQIQIEDEHDGWFVGAERDALWNDARTNIKMLESAKEELALFKGELKDWQNQQADNGIGPKGELGNAWANAGQEHDANPETPTSEPTNIPTRNL